MSPAGYINTFIAAAEDGRATTTVPWTGACAVNPSGYMLSAGRVGGSSGTNPRSERKRVCQRQLG